MYALCTQLKSELDALRPLAPALVRNLDDWLRVELTWSSNAIEGNTLTRRETALVVEKGLTVGGKTLIEHLEARNHARAFDAVNNLIERDAPSEADILAIHALVLAGIDDDHAGQYRTVPVRISGSDVIMPNHAKVRALTQTFVRSLAEPDPALHPVARATDAHYQLVTIHPFVDGNGRTARLLMNLLLMQAGYPPAVIRPRERERYIASLEKAQLGGSRDDFEQLIVRSVERSLALYLKAGRGENAPSVTPTSALLRIGELAKLSGQTVPTIRHWTQNGLLDVSDHTASGYALYDRDQVERIERVIDLKSQGYSLKGIALQLKA